MKKQVLFILIALLIGAGSASAQMDSLWSHSYSGFGVEEANTVVQMADGGYAMAGYINDDNGYTHFRLVRTDANGDTLWTRQYGGALSDRCFSMVKTTDGGFALAGYTESYGAGDKDFWLVKTNANGVLQWSQSYGDASYQEPRVVIQTADGGYAIAGYTHVGGVAWDVVWLVKTDGNGAQQWTQSFNSAPGVQGGDICHDLLQTPDGGYALAGNSSRGGNGTDYYLIKTAANGAEQWSHTYHAGMPEEICYSVVQTADGGFAMAGDTRSLGAGESDYYLVKTDANGAQEWDRTYGGASHDYCFSIVQTTDAGFALAGWTMSFGAGGPDFWLVKIAANGDSLWSRTFGGGNLDLCNSVIQTADGGYAMTGSTQSFGGAGSHFWLVKTGYAFNGYNDFVETQDDMTVLVTAANFDNQPVPTGWEIGIFTPGAVQSGGGVWTNGQQLGIPAFGDDNQTQAVEGFVAGETMNFRLWDNVANVEYPALAIVSQGSLNWQDGGATALSLQGYQIYTMDLFLPNNWSIISVNVVPPPSYWTGNQGPHVPLMMQQFGAHLVLMKDEHGHFYWPSMNYNNIAFWNLTEGYKVKMDQQMQGSWTGALIPAATSIPLTQGWNIAAYFPTYTLSASSATNPPFHVINPIVNHVLMAKNGHGQFMIPAGNYSGMANWEESQGYQIKVDANVVLNYPAHDNQIDAYSSPTVPSDDSHWSDPMSTGANMSVLVASIGGVNVQDGDQVAAIDANGKIVGVGTVQDGKCGVAVWGDDPSTDAVDGLKNGEAFTLRLYSSAKNAEMGIEANITQGTLAYETDGFTAVAATVAIAVPDNFYLSQSFPNPFNSTTRLAFGLPEASHVTMQIFDMNGRLVSTLADANFEAGNHAAVWNADAAPAGLYMVKMQAGSFSDVRKLTLVK